MFKRIVMVFLILAMHTAWADEGQNHEVHQELRALLQGIETDVNAQHFDKLKQYFDENAHITTINQQVIVRPDAIESYFNEWFGKGGYLVSLTLKLTPDALTNLYGDENNPNWGLVYGTGVEDYQLADGRFLPMKTRWTATVTKSEDGKWRIMALHIGANFYDNPIFAAVKDSTKYYAAGGFIGGLLIGIVLLWFAKRKSSK
jgi:hypothetical protein